MGLSSLPDRPLKWSHRVVQLLFALATSGFRIRLDFSDGQKCELGPNDMPVAVAVRPPDLWETIWIFLNPGLRTGESFMKGRWAVTEGSLVTFLRIIQTPRHGIYSTAYRSLSNWRGPIFQIRQKLFTEWNRRQNADHYNVGNAVYGRMLDSSSQYSCAFFSLSEKNDLESAQQTKLRVTIERLHIDRPNLKIVDIGCGFGALAARLAEMPGNHNVTGITQSSDQLKVAISRSRSLPIEIQKRLSYFLDDYRKYFNSSNNCFDRIVSIGMFEHVGLGRHRHFFRTIEASLAADGRALVHSIVSPAPGSCNEWIRRYIFPGSFLPSVAEFIAAAEKSKLIVDAIHIHPPSDYRKTIQSWRDRFEAAWPAIHGENYTIYDEVFKRMWLFYLAAVETIFTEDLMNYRIAQIELRKAPSTP